MEAPSGNGSQKALKSMTGFGRSRRVAGSVEIVTEIRAVNHRFLDVSVRLPKIYSLFEPEIRKIVSDAIDRGKIDVVVTRSGGKSGLVDVMLDEELAQSYHACLLRLRERFRLAGEISISDMLTFHDLLVPVEREDVLEQEWPEVEQCLREALAALDHMRRTEAVALWADMSSRIRSIADRTAHIRTMAETVSLAARERLEKRVRELTGGLELDQNRLHQEAALIADRSDVTEELTRINSHAEQFLSLGPQGSPVGRKLDFLLQELLRETNTVGAKSASTDIASHVVNIKVELEKIREQIQNIE
ncbi:MAG: YicC family protein [Desulfomonile tiedjei]|nr:YicC family protein [Desulfomonile tiedjei]